MKRRMFCSYCGREITTDSERYNVILRDRTEKKDQKILQLCADDIKIVRRMKFTPNRCVRTRKLPKFFTVKISHFGKEESLYIVPDYQAMQICELKKIGSASKLIGSDGRQYFTKEYILHHIEFGDDARKNLLAWNRLLFTKQTEDEKKEYKTKWHNNSGYNQSDAKFMSAMAKITFDKSDDAITDAQYETLKKRFRKYAQQVADLLNEE